MKWGIGLRREIIASDPLLILLLSVASIWRKLLKTSHTEERIVHTN